MAREASDYTLHQGPYTATASQLQQYLTELVRLLQAGCSLVFISSRKEKACQEAVDALNNLGCSGKAISIPADLSKSSDIDKLVEGVKKHTDHVDILIANAGATWGAKFDDHRKSIPNEHKKCLRHLLTFCSLLYPAEDAFNKVIHLNVQSVFVSIQKFANLLRKNATKEEPARVVITGSIAGIGVGTVG